MDDKATSQQRAPSDAQQLQLALLSAFPSRASLQALLRSGLDEHLDTISAGRSLSATIGDLIRWAERRGRLPELIAAACIANPGNAALRAYAEQRGTVADIATRPGGQLDPPAPVELALSAQQFQQLQRALLSAFPSRADLRALLTLDLDLHLDALAAGHSLSALMFDVLRWAQRHGRLIDLIGVASMANPGNAALRACAEELGLMPAITLMSINRDTSSASAPQHLSAWLGRMRQIEHAICRIEIDGGRDLATGFLLGPSIVMTCHTVIAELPSAPLVIGLRFGYQTRPNDTTPGHVYRLADDWLLASSPRDQLNYALLRIAHVPGYDPARRWLFPSGERRLQPGAPLLLAQHAQTGPHGIAIKQQAILDIDQQRRRVYYHLQSPPSGAGAPCFDDRLELVAMHESFDPGAGYAQAIPITSIIAEPAVRATLGS